ncbi:methyl-accepting chemotaxis protein [Marinobacterium sp. AK62]|uniref:Methyl-accepting chemotaxis protein n=1 Tax=Marinobacterium alkalitolerans TaxID=1542925 RepID=A0ABS3Z9F8_9GAMM|nr:methyl-accepting chemotaxis protein [Marinobacterium alkalitolerans]MBP0048340.1 methyl-accepting chemotaxis protein [Marinobacterium alkalitolerans]
MSKSISHKIVGCFLLTLAVLLGTGLYALNGVTSVRDALERVAGEVWSAADNASTLNLNVSQGTGQLERSLAYQEPIPPHRQQQVDQHLARALSALDALQSGQYRQESKSLAPLMKQLEQLKVQVVDEHQAFNEDIAASEETVQRFQAFMKRLGFYGNFQISSLEDAFQRNQINSWGGDVDEKWNFVLAIYKARIAFGASIRALQTQLQSSTPANHQEQVQESLDRLSDELNEIIRSPLADRSINSGEWKGNTYAQAAEALLSTHQQQVKQIQHRQHNFLATRNLLLSLVNKLEQQTTGLRNTLNSEVSAQTEQAMQQANRLNTTMLLSLPAGIGLTLLAIWLCFRIVIKPVKQVSASMAEISSGKADLSVRLPVRGQDEIAQLAENFNRFVARIADTVKLVANSNQQLVKTAEHLKQNAQATMRSVEQQNQQSTQAVTAMAEINDTVNDIAANASEAAQRSETIQSNATTGRDMVERNRGATEHLANEIQSVTDVISQLADESSRAGSILTVISGIAEQTNLLALNAAIEAARAGEHGRSFAVVADEVRQLSQNTQKATEEISALLDALQVKASDAVTAMQKGQALAGENVSLSEQVHEQIERIAADIDQISQLNLQIATATEEQAQVTTLTHNNLEQIGLAASETEDSARSNAEFSTQLEQQAAEMKKTLVQFES